MQIEERPQSWWTPLKIIGAIVLVALAGWGLFVLLFLIAFFHGGFTF